MENTESFQIPLSAKGQIRKGSSHDVPHAVARRIVLPWVQTARAVRLHTGSETALAAKDAWEPIHLVEAVSGGPTIQPSLKNVWNAEQGKFFHQADSPRQAVSDEVHSPSITVDTIEDFGSNHRENIPIINT